MMATKCEKATALLRSLGYGRALGDKAGLLRIACNARVVEVYGKDGAAKIAARKSLAAEQRDLDPQNIGEAAWNAVATAIDSLAV